MQGVARRIGTLSRCIETVFSILPPNQTTPPEKDILTDASINIQAFVTNVSGCCDNLAWLWVHECGVVQDDGSELANGMVGLSKKYKQVWRSFSLPFRDYLKSRDEWFEHTKGFRDSLSHRIPLYIPPYVVDPDNGERYGELESAAWNALLAGDLEKHDGLLAEQDKLKFFRPWMSHSFAEASPMAVFHAQLLADFYTVEELGLKFLEELSAAET